MNKNVKVLATTTALSLLLSTNVFAHEGEIEVGENTGSNLPYRVVMQGKEIKSDIPSIESHNKVYIPLRTVMNEFGTNLTWDNNSRTVMLDKAGMNTNITPKANHANIRINLNGKDITPEDVLN